MTKTPSERINLIQEISKKTKDIDWPIIDLTLRQFGLPTTDQWEGNKEGYVMNMIDSADDETLSQLAYHLSGNENNDKSSTTIEFWQPGQYKLFLSHVSEHKIMAAELKEKLSSFHISTFVAHEDISPTKEWQTEIELALDTMDCLVALVTEDFHSSLWTDQELGMAIGKGKLVIPINCGCSPYGFLSKYQWLKSLDMDVNKISKDIFQILNTHNMSKKIFSEAIVNKFESSYSFQSAKENMGLLEKIDYLDADLITRIKTAYESNPQINDTYNMAYRVNKLINKVQRF